MRARHRAAADFRERHKLPFHCLADADQAAYHAFELSRGGLSQIAGPKVWLAGLKSMLKAGIGKPVGDVRQMPGSFVIDSGGVIRFAHHPHHSSEYPSHDEMIRQIQSLRDAN